MYMHVCVTLCMCVHTDTHELLRKKKELPTSIVIFCHKFSFTHTEVKLYLQDISQNTNCPHICVEAHWLSLHNLWCSKFSCPCWYLHNLIWIQLCCKSEVYQLDICTVSCLAHDIFRLDVCWEWLIYFFIIQMLYSWKQNMQLLCYEVISLCLSKCHTIKMYRTMQTYSCV